MEFSYWEIILELCLLVFFFWFIFVLTGENLLSQKLECKAKIVSKEKINGAENVFSMPPMPPETALMYRDQYLLFFEIAGQQYSYPVDLDTYSRHHEGEVLDIKYRKGIMLGTIAVTAIT